MLLMLTIVDPIYLLFALVVAATMAYFHYHDNNVESKKQPPIKRIAPASLDKNFVDCFNAVEAKARVSYTDEEKQEVDRLIEVFKEQHSQYPETRYNVQILQCINRMRNKEDLKYTFEFQN